MLAEKFWLTFGRKRLEKSKRVLESCGAKAPSGFSQINEVFFLPLRTKARKGEKNRSSFTP